MGGDRPDSPSRGEADKFRVHWSAVSPGHAANGGLGKEKARNCAARGYATVTDTLLVQMRLKVSTIRSHGPGINRRMTSLRNFRSATTAKHLTGIANLRIRGKAGSGDSRGYFRAGTVA
jgi:hypothetical protein